MPIATPEARRTVGKPIPRQEGPEKVTGQTKYSADILLPGMLFGKILRSPHPHARIVSIDASGAWEVPGVHAVITGKDIPGLLMGRRFRDMPVLAWDKVRYIGDRVAAVAADTVDIAEEALNRIVVEYEELPAVFDALAAMKEDAPRLHDDITQYKGGENATLIPDVPNGLTYQKWVKGDIEEGFKLADHIFEHEFRTPSRHGGFIEPHAGSLMIDDDGHIQVWMATKSPFATRDQLSWAINVPTDQITVNTINVGGDFGGKGDAIDLPIAYYLAKQSGRPVLMLMNYLEELQAGNPTHPSIVTIKTGVTKDGRIVARWLHALHDSGAYAAFKPGPNVNVGGAAHGGGPYLIPHVFTDTMQVYTNTVPRGIFRAPGATQVVFAVESHMDLIAKELGMDPAEFRLKNILHSGDVSTTGHKLRDVQAEGVLRAAMEAIGWWTPPAPNHGRGIALFERHILAGQSSAVLTGEVDGTMTILSPSFDQGTGIHVVLRQIVSEFFKLPIENIQVKIGNTDTVPLDGGVGGQRVTNGAGNAFLKASTELLETLKAVAADRFECPPEEVVTENGVLYPREAPRRQMTLAEAIAEAGGGQSLTVTTSVTLAVDNALSDFAAQATEVEVDPETGQFKIHKFVTAHDVGQVMNPITFQGQIDGGFVQGLGVALMEEMPIDEGRVTTLHLGDYKLPTIADVPPLETVLVQAEEGPAPFGGRAIGEMGNVAVAPAIANAIANAVGVRLYNLPITAEKIFFALRGGEA